MATTPSKLLRALVDYYQGGVKVYAAGHVYPESDALLLMKARNEAEVPKATADTKATKAAREAAEKTEREAKAAAEKAEREAKEAADAEATAKALAEQGGQGSANTPPDAPTT